MMITLTMTLIRTTSSKMTTTKVTLENSLIIKITKPSNKRTTTKIIPNAVLFITFVTKRNVNKMMTRMKTMNRKIDLREL